MKTDLGFIKRLAAASEYVRSGDKDLIRKLMAPKQVAPVSEGMSDLEVADDLTPPGKLDAAKNDKSMMVLILPGMKFIAKPLIRERPAMKQDKKDVTMPDAVIPLTEIGVGTITFDTDKGSTMVGSTPAETELVEAAAAVLRRLDTMNEEEFAADAEAPDRERLRKALDPFMFD